MGPPRAVPWWTRSPHPGLPTKEMRPPSAGRSEIGSCRSSTHGGRWSCSSRATSPGSGKEAFDASVTAMLDDARDWRLAEMRWQRGMPQEQVALRMGISVARVSQIERGDVSTQDVLNRYVSSLGGTLNLIADFGDEQLKIA